MARYFSPSTLATASICGRSCHLKFLRRSTTIWPSAMSDLVSTRQSTFSVFMMDSSMAYATASESIRAQSLATATVFPVASHGSVDSSGMPRSPRPSEPCENGSRGYLRTRGFSGPCPMGTSSRLIMDSTFLRFWVQELALRLPDTVVMALTSRFPGARASSSALASSMPGSQSITTFLIKTEINV
ncbi:hypothetical protein OGATHE_000442 [Ogataea polymorpha]|uniref:Uncharacterized protein n=1 Tax=Ogataea polymorpha TaxID=460523 RepID=A0A9P8PSW6_9ASCO|nr:hypothetical protein OGATHE_000442 [Ogataea polymorpha]